MRFSLRMLMAGMAAAAVYFALAFAAPHPIPILAMLAVTVLAPGPLVVGAVYAQPRAFWLGAAVVSVLCFLGLAVTSNALIRDFIGGIVDAWNVDNASRAVAVYIASHLLTIVSGIASAALVRLTRANHSP